MFTGIIQVTGRVARIQQSDDGARLQIEAPYKQYVVGESIAVDGICLTVESASKKAFNVFASKETLDVSALADRRVGDRVHLERALRVGDSLGGHFLTGHVDAVTTLRARKRIGESWALSFALPKTLRYYVAAKGSVAVDGVSLTVNEVSASRFTVMIIPHTAQATRLGQLAVGARVNLEIDVIARYVVNALSRVS